MSQYRTFLGIIFRLRLTCWGVLLASFVFVPHALAQSDVPQLTVVAPVLSIRSGPDASYPAFDTLPQGRTTGIIGYNPKTGWWQVVSVYGSPGWVSGNAADVTINEAAFRQFVAPQPQQPAPFVPPTTRPGVIVFQTASGGPIYVVNPDGSNLRYVTTGLDPALSPDGQWVAFTRWDNPQIGALGSVGMINIDGSGEKLVHQGVNQPKSPAWSPDGSQLIVSMAYGERLIAQHKCSGERPPRDATDIVIKREGKDDIVYCFTLLPKPYWGLRLINLASGQFEDLNYDTHSVSPTWDPANPARIIYTGGWGLVSLDLTQGKSQPLTGDVQQHTPAFSPDGSKLAVSYRQSDHWDIHVLNADGSSDTRLTETSYLTWVQQELNGEKPRSYNNTAPAWSPNGLEIAFLTDRTGQWEIWLMNADGSNQRPLLPAAVLATISVQYNGMNERVLSWR